MKTICLVMFVLIANANVIIGQTIKTATESKSVDYRVPIIKLLGKFTNSKRLLEIPREHVYIYSISLAFNGEGIVDTVYFSDIKSENLKQIINTNQDMTDAMNSIDFNRAFINKLVIFPIIIQRKEDWKIDNPNEFLIGILTLWPKLKLEDKLKPVVFLDPLINNYSIPIR